MLALKQPTEIIVEMNRQITNKKFAQHTADQKLMDRDK